jgi:hypothetical protein
MGEASSHEFGAADDVVFLDLAGSASRVGLAGYALGAVLLVAGAVGLAQPPFHLPHHAAPVVAVVTLLGAAPPALAARHLRASAERLRAVALTQGDDVAHLMAAVDGLHRAFTSLAAMLGVDALGLAAVVALLLPRGA